jgi:hypothetical protein
VSAIEEERRVHQLKQKGMVYYCIMEIDRDHDYLGHGVATSSNFDPLKENNPGEIQRKC